MRRPVLCSACLLGITCRYDGRAKPNNQVIALASKENLIPVCPEILGGLPTPRERAEIKKDRVFTLTGKNQTRKFKKGAKQVLKIAKLFKVETAIFADKSPSCGVYHIYDGSFSNRLIKGEGICTRLLRQHGIKVITPKDIKKKLFSNKNQRS